VKILVILGMFIIPEITIFFVTVFMNFKILRHTSPSCLFFNHKPAVTFTPKI